MKDLDIIRERIKERREELGYSYQNLADLTHLSKSTLQRYETGGSGNLPLDKLEVLANALKCSPTYLMGWDECGEAKVELSDDKYELIYQTLGLTKLAVDQILKMKIEQKYDKMPTLAMLNALIEQEAFYNLLTASSFYVQDDQIQIDMYQKFSELYKSKDFIISAEMMKYFISSVVEKEYISILDSIKKNINNKDESNGNIHTQSTQE